jgi:peptidyl-prolyl cis-trans isomerase SurA
LLGLLLVLPAAERADSAELLDEPIAVVGNRVVLRSEWETQIALYAMQARIDASDPAMRDSLGQSILDQMINDVLVLIAAEQDTMLTVSTEEIDLALQDHILSLQRRFKSEDEFRQALANEGLTQRDLRVRYRQDVENQLLKQKLMQRKLAQVAVSHGEVIEFYEFYKDSLPMRPAGIKIAHILLKLDVSKAMTDSVRGAMTGILEEIRGGLDFAEAARRYSTDASAPVGGDLGWFARGQMVAQFDEAAFSLSPGQISGVVRSPFGWHLIQCVERDSDRIHARHIIMTLSPSAADTARVMVRADSLAQQVRAGDDFCLLAQEFSNDAESQKNCGELGWYPVDEMYDEFKIALRDADAGAIVGPVSTEFGWHVLRILERRDAHKLNLEENWDGVKQIARQDKTNRILAEWIEDIRERTHVDIRPLSGSITLEAGGE